MRISKSSRSSNKLVAISVIYAIWIYIATKTPIHYYDDFLATGLFVSVFLLGIILFLINLGAFIFQRNLLSFPLFILCALVSMLMPAITPEDIYFIQHKADYEKVVEIVRQHNIEHNGRCQYDYLPPKGYEYLTIEDCIFVKYEPVLEVVFTPRVSGRFLFYTESLSLGNFCGDGFGLIEKEIDNHWCVCGEYWN